VGEALVYTLTVATDHDFFVGPAGVLVHNAGPCPVSVDPQTGEVTLTFSKKSYPQYSQSLQHIEDVEARYPSVLTIDRGGARANRGQSLRDVSTAPGMERDEYPPAMFAEGGNFGGNGADVRLIPSADNQGLGAVIGNLLRPFENGTKVRIVVTP
jgi:hypothetical protein